MGWIKSLFQNRSLRNILLFAFILRVVVSIPIWSSPDRMFQNDSPSYYKVAQNLYNGNGYSNCPSAPFYKDVLRTPTYPVIIAATKFITGDSRILFLLQLLTDLVTTFLIYRIGSKLFNEIAALIAGALYAVSIINVVMCTQVLAETIFVFLLIISLYCVIVSKKYIIAGLALGLAVLCKPIGLFLILFYVAYLVVSKKSLKQMTFLILLFLLLTTGWMLRNQQVTGSLTISSISSYNLFAYNANMVLSQQKGKSESILREERIAEVYNRTEGELGDYSGKYDYIEVFDKEGKEVILSNLCLYSFLHLRNSINCLIPGVHYVLELWGQTKGKRGTMDVLRKEGIVKATGYYFESRWVGLVLMIPWMLCWGGMLLAAVLGGINMLLRRKWDLVLLIILPGLYFLFISGPAAEPRFGALLAPYFCLLGGSYLGSFDKIKSRL